MKRPLQSLAGSVARVMMRSNLLWEAVRRLPSHDLFYRQRYSVIRKRARRKCAAYLERREILAGPFQGMKYAEEASVGSSLWPKLLGTYESELLPCFAAIARDHQYGKIIDVGYAEGYYLIGFGRVFQHAKLVGFDSELEAQRLCKANAQANGIENHRLELFGAFDAQTLRDALNDDRKKLVIVDCEGIENDVISGLHREQLSSADWLIETHDHLVEGTTQRLVEVFRETHLLTEVETDDGLESKCRLLPQPIRQMCDLYEQESLVSEGRLAKQHWIFATRRAA